MYLLERLAEEKIQEAIERGELDNLPGAGRPLSEDAGLELVAPELRMAYRILKNAGYVPEEVQLRREISDIVDLLGSGGAEAEVVGRARARLLLLQQRLGQIGGGNLAIGDRYFRKISEKLTGRSDE